MNYQQMNFASKSILLFLILAGIASSGWAQKRVQLKKADNAYGSMKDGERFDRLISDYKNLELEKREFETRSVTDVLTGAMNRAGVQQFIEQLFSTDRSGQMGVLLLDVDHFKAVNDQFGHDVGDRVLTDVAKLIAQNTRLTDVFGRWGGEEFILICPQVPAEHLSALAEKFAPPWTIMFLPLAAQLYTYPSVLVQPSPLLMNHLRRC